MKVESYHQESEEDYTQEVEVHRVEVWRLVMLLDSGTLFLYDFTSKVYAGNVLHSAGFSRSSHFDQIEFH
jgi:hypothetical protein